MNTRYKLVKLIEMIDENNESVFGYEIISHFDSINEALDYIDCLPKDAIYRLIDKSQEYEQIYNSSPFEV
jgi:hypothetical protein